MCRRATADDHVPPQVRADEATTNHEENNHGLFSLSADAGTSSGSSIILYAMVGIAILGKHL